MCSVVVHYIYAHIPLEPIIKSPRIFMDIYNKLIAELNHEKQAIFQVQLVDLKYKFSEPLKAIIDTGCHYNICASRLFINAEIENLNVSVQMEGLGGIKIDDNLFKCKMLIKDISENRLVDFQFTKSENVFNEIDIVLGTDFLQNFIFKYNVPIGNFSLEYKKT